MSSSETGGQAISISSPAACGTDRAQNPYDEDFDYAAAFAQLGLEAVRRDLEALRWKDSRPAVAG